MIRTVESPSPKRVMGVRRTSYDSGLMSSVRLWVISSPLLMVPSTGISCSHQRCWAIWAAKKAEMEGENFWVGTSGYNIVVISLSTAARSACWWQRARMEKKGLVPLMSRNLIWKFRLQRKVTQGWRGGRRKPGRLRILSWESVCEGNSNTRKTKQRWLHCEWASRQVRLCVCVVFRSDILKQMPHFSTATTTTTTTSTSNARTALTSATRGSKGQWQETMNSKVMSLKVIASKNPVRLRRSCHVKLEQPGSFIPTRSLPTRHVSKDLG